MTIQTEDRNPIHLIIRKIAKVWSAFSIGLIVLLFIGEIISPHPGDEPIQARERIELLFFAFTIFGMAIAWRWEALGGIISSASFVIFIVMLTINRGEFIDWRGSVMLFLVAIPGFLFLASWLLARNSDELDKPQA